MENAPVTAATGSLGPVIAKLAALLGSEYKLRWRTRRDVKFIRSKLKPVHSILWNIWEREELDEVSMALKMEALDLADELDDAIVDFVLNMERSGSTKRLVQTKIKESPFKDFKKQAGDVSRQCHTKWKKPLSSLAADDPRPGKPRAYPFVRKYASELVGMAEPQYKLVKHLIEEDEGKQVQLQLKAAFIYGTAGMGKTTLADLVYEAIGSKFQSRAFVSITPGGNMMNFLEEILQQVAANTSTVPLAGNQAATEEDLIAIISNFLEDKRYLVIIDDIWNCRDWDVIMKSLPENNLGSRIVGTTRIKDIAKKWRSYGPNATLHEILTNLLWDDEEGWAYKIGENNIATQIIAVKAELVPEGFNDKHPIVHMCGGTPLAVLCMLSAVSQELEKQGQHAKACDVQDDIEKNVKEKGIQNTPGFEPLVESLQLSYDDLPHHMLKTCLLYCSIYPDGHIFQKNKLMRRWISEGFVYAQDVANGYFAELMNRGLIEGQPGYGYRKLHHPKINLMMHPLMRNFLRWKSRQDNFTTCSSEITPSYNNIWRIRRLCICNSPCRSSDAAADPLSTFDWYHVRSLVVYKGIETVPLEKLEGVRVLDLCSITRLRDHHLKDICGLVRVRHLLGLNGDGIIEIPPEIVGLQCLETLETCGFTRLPGFIGNLQQLKTLVVRDWRINELPREIGALKQLHTLRIKSTCIAELPREIGELQQLRSLDISRTPITVLPKEIGKLQQLEQLHMSYTKVAKISREIGALKELKSLKLDDSIVAVPLEVCAFAEMPECIHQAVSKSGLVSELAGEMLSFQNSLAPRLLAVIPEGGLVVGAKQMLIPPWIKEHFNYIALLDIRICKLEEGGLKVLREMPRLEELTLRFEVVPREPVVISSEGFEDLEALTIDSRVPRVTFQEGAMPELYSLEFQFQFYAGPPNKDPVGTNHLRSLYWISFKCNEDWYGGGDSPCIRPTIDVVRKEARELPNLCGFKVCGRQEEIWSPPPSPPPRLEMHQPRMEEGTSSGMGEIEEVIQA